MVKYKITCNDVRYLGHTVIGNDYKGVTFEGVGYTDNDDVANDFRNNGVHHGGEPIFTVEEVDEDE